jgi:hypothetical protein
MKRALTFACVKSRIESSFRLSIAASCRIDRAAQAANVAA